MISPPTITLFGGTGFIGRVLAQSLARQGFLLRFPTRHLDQARSLQPLGDVGQITPFLSSSRSDEAVTRALEGADTVINLIGIFFEKGHNTFQSVHVETAARIARIAKEQGVKDFIHVSALGAKSPSKSRYAKSKVCGEEAVRTFFPEAIIFRPSIVFGPGDKFLNLFANLARFTPILPLLGGGTTKFQPVYVGDVAEAVRRTLTNPAARGNTYELGGPSLYSFRQLLELVLKETHRSCTLVHLPWGLAKLKATFLELLPSPPLTRDQVELLKTDNVVWDRTAKTLADLGIKPRTLEAVVPTYMNSYRAGGVLSVSD